MRALKAIVLVVVLSGGTIACNSGGDDIATLMPTASGSGAESQVSDESPRSDTPGNSDLIPATWTPMPTAEAPPRPATRTPDETYIVQPGDTLAELAAQFGVELEELARVNNIQDIDLIEVGQIITIPR